MKRWTEEEMATKMNKIHNMDCLEFMRQVPDDYFDLVLTDPPYNVGIDYGIYKDNLSDVEYLLFIEDTMVEIKRISKNAIIYPPKKYFLEYWNILGKEFQQIIFTTSTAGSIRYKHKNQYSSILTNANPNGLPSNHYHNIPMPHDGFMFREEKYGHKGYTSNSLIRLLLDNYSMNNYKIFDPFMGTGSVSVVSKEKGICFCGTELEPDYCEIANKRLSKVQTSMFAFMDEVTA